MKGGKFSVVVIKGSRSARPDNTEENVAQAKTRAILMHGAQHAREWISVSTVCYIAYQLIAGYYTDESVRKLVDEFEWKYSPSTIELTVVYFQC